MRPAFFQTLEDEIKSFIPSHKLNNEINSPKNPQPDLQKIPQQTSLDIRKENSKNIDKLYILSANCSAGVLETIAEFLEKNPEVGFYYDVGIAEANMISMAGGLAKASLNSDKNTSPKQNQNPDLNNNLNHKIPSSSNKILCYSIGIFPTIRALEQIRNDVLLPNLDVKIISSGGGFSPIPQNGPSHHMTEDLSAVRSLPGIEIFSPCDEFESKIVAQIIMEEYGPQYVRLSATWNTQVYGRDLNTSEISNIKQGIPNLVFTSSELKNSLENSQKHSLENSAKTFPKHSLKNPPKTVIFAHGPIIAEAVLALENIQQNLKNSDRIFEIYSVCKFPIHSQAIVEISQNATQIFTLEEHNINGLGSAIAEIIADQNINVPLKRLGLTDFAYDTGTIFETRQNYGLDADSLAKMFSD